LKKSIDEFLENNQHRHTFEQSNGSSNSLFEEIQTKSISERSVKNQNVNSRTATTNKTVLQKSKSCNKNRFSFLASRNTLISLKKKITKSYFLSKYDSRHVARSKKFASVSKLILSVMFKFNFIRILITLI
jgi:hypothetical protein